MKTKCPKCNVTYEVADADIGKECECPCGNKFIAAMAPPKKPYRRPITSLVFVGVGALMMVGGLLTSAGAPFIGGAMAFLCGAGIMILAAPFFAIAHVIDFLAEIAYNTRA